MPDARAVAIVKPGRERRHESSTADARSGQLHADKSVRVVEDAGASPQHGAGLRLPELTVLFRASAVARSSLLRGLAQTHGNRYVQRLLATCAMAHPSAAPALQRYEAGEHAQFGGKTGKQKNVTVNGVTMTYGEMIAMADLFESFEQMKTADPKQIEALVKLIQEDAAKPSSVTPAKWHEATGGRYLDLAEKNTAHFAPSDELLVPARGGTVGQDHKAAWEAHHLAALQLAQQGKKDEALALNAFGDHYLTDAFAAGHLVNKPDVMTHFRIALGTDTAFFDAVAKIAWADSTVSSLLSQYEPVKKYEVEWAPDFRPNIHNAERFSFLLQEIYKQRPDALVGVIVRLVHDRLNDFPGGIEVKNAFETWNLPGDATLDSDTKQKTLEYGRKAVGRSQQNVLGAVGLVGPLDLPALFQAVWDFVPRPTKWTGYEAVREVVDQRTDPANQDVIAEMAKLLIKNITVIVAKLIAEKALRKA
jgi:hypothetical protein